MRQQLFNDLQEVQTTIALNYHISPSQANIIYQQLVYQLTGGVDSCLMLLVVVHFLFSVATPRQNQTK
jgi:hypothetical protein